MWPGEETAINQTNLGDQLLCVFKLIYVYILLTAVHLTLPRLALSRSKRKLCRTGESALFPECCCPSLHVNRAWLKVLRYCAPVGFRLSCLSRTWEGTFVLLTSRTKTWPHADCQSRTYLMAYFMCNQSCYAFFGRWRCFSFLQQQFCFAVLDETPVFHTWRSKCWQSNSICAAKSRYVNIVNVFYPQI